MLTLYKFGPIWGVPDASPFCVKLETYLRMAGLEYATEKGAQNLKLAPKKKMPFIDHDGRRVADSEFVIDYLKKTFGDTVDGHLSADQKAIGKLIQRTLDEHCYFTLVHSRWLDARNWPLVRDAFFRPVPALLRGFVAAMMQKRVRKMIYSQGTGRHSEAEMYAQAIDDLKTVLHLLGDKPFIFGDTPCSTDAVIFSYFANLNTPPMTSPLHAFIESEPRATAYCERMYARFYPDWKR